MSLVQFCPSAVRPNKKQLKTRVGSFIEKHLNIEKSNILLSPFESQMKMVCFYVNRIKNLINLLIDHKFPKKLQIDAYFI